MRRQHAFSSQMRYDAALAELPRFGDRRCDAVVSETWPPARGFGINADDTNRFRLQIQEHIVKFEPPVAKSVRFLNSFIVYALRFAF